MWFLLQFESGRFFQMKRPFTLLVHLVNCLSLLQLSNLFVALVEWERERCLMNRRRLFALHWQPTWCGRAGDGRKNRSSEIIALYLLSSGGSVYQSSAVILSDTRFLRHKTSPMKASGRNNVLTEKWMRVKNTFWVRSWEDKICKDSSSWEGFIGGGIRTRNRIVGSEMQ